MHKVLCLRSILQGDFPHEQAREDTLLFRFTQALIFYERYVYRHASIRHVTYATCEHMLCSSLDDRHLRVYAVNNKSLTGHKY